MKANRRAGAVMVAGIVLLLGGLWLSGAGEHRAVTWHRGLAQLGGGVLMLGPDTLPDAGQYGHLALISGTPEVVEPPRDPDFHVRADAPRLVRKVEMFQWHEVRVGGQVSYQQDWVDHAVDSSRFEHPAGHANMQAFPFPGRRFTAPVVRLGHYLLAPAIVRALPGPMHPLKPDLGRLPPNLQASFQVQGDGLTTSADPQHPRLGDLRVQWLVAPLRQVTVVARVDGNRLVPAPQILDGEGFRVQVGQQSLTDVFAGLPLPPAAVWVWRAVALLLAWAGAWLILLAWRRSPSTRAAAALASAVALIGLVVGGVWLGASVSVSVIAWAVAALAALAAWLCWKRLA